MVPGKTYTIVVQAGDCSLKDVTVLASGSGLTLKQVNTDQNQTCSWTGTLTVSQDAEFSEAQLILQWPDKPSASLPPIHIVAKAAGPIPPGLRPTVDVAWKVISRRVSSDNFGAWVTKLYYPVEVVIGNNSGYDLQLASIEFELPAKHVMNACEDRADPGRCVPSDSYFVVRSSLEREQSIGLRDTTVNIVNAIGPILTGSAIFFNGSSLHALHHKAVFQGFTSIFASPFESALELIWPDETVRQLIKLDNHSLRDGINRRPLRTTKTANRPLRTTKTANRPLRNSAPQAVCLLRKTTTLSR